MISLVKLVGEYRNTSVPLSSGYGLKIRDYVVAHSSVVDNISCRDGIVFVRMELDPFALRPKYYTVQASILHQWTCKSFRSCLHSYCNLEDFRLLSIERNASFVLLSLYDIYTPVNPASLARIMREIRSAVQVDPDVYQGKGVWFIKDCPDNSRRFSKQTAVISYAFGSRTFFVIDANAPTSQIIFSDGLRSEECPFIGMVIYTDLMRYPFQGFPMCISLNHLLSEDCLANKCTLRSAVSNPTSDLILSTPYAEYSFVVQCGTNIGSGSLISDTIIITCSHIMFKNADLNGVKVFFRGDMLDCKVLFNQDENVWPDIALLELSQRCRTAPVLAMSPDRPAHGQNVIAVGTPHVKSWFWQEAWVSTGRIIGFDDEDVYATCSIHEGFSGGGLLDDECRLVGILRAKALSVTHGRHPRLIQAASVALLKAPICEFIQSRRSSVDKKNLVRNLQANRLKRISRL